MIRYMEIKFSNQLRNVYTLMIYHFEKAENLDKVDIYKKKQAANQRWKAVGRMMTGVLFMRRLSVGKIR